jgi:hypothetical protein
MSVQRYGGESSQTRLQILYETFLCQSKLRHGHGAHLEVIFSYKPDPVFINPHQPTRNNYSTYEIRLPVATNIWLQGTNTILLPCMYIHVEYRSGVAWKTKPCWFLFALSFPCTMQNFYTNSLYATEHILRSLTSPTHFRNFSPFVEATCCLPCSQQLATEPHKSNQHRQYLFKLISILFCHLSQYLQNGLLYAFFKMFHILCTDHLSSSILQ